MCFTQSLIKPAHPNWGSSKFSKFLFCHFRDISVAVVRKLRGQTLRCSLDNWDLTKIDETILFACQAFVLWMQKKHNALVFWKHPKGTLVATDSSLSQGVDRHGWLDSGGPSHFKPWRVWLNNLTLKCSIYRKNPSNPAQIKTCNQHGNIVEHVPMVPSSFQRINLHKLP